MPIATWDLVEDQTVEVPQNSYDVDLYMEAEPGDRIKVSADGQIWAGVLFTGWNGSEGWKKIAGDSKFPLPSARAYGLLLKVADRYHYVGRGRTVTTKDGGALALRINDDDPNTGDGSFTVNVQLLRRT